MDWFYLVWWGCCVCRVLGLAYVLCWLCGLFWFAIGGLGGLRLFRLGGYVFAGLFGFG